MPDIKGILKALQKKRAAAQGEVERLDAAIQALQGPAGPAKRRGRPKGRKFSIATKKKMREAQRRRREKEKKSKRAKTKPAGQAQPATA